MATRDVDDSPELRRLLEQEKEQLMVKQMVSKLTSVCWDKCITSTPGNKLSPGEAACLSNCARRFLDMSMILAKRFQLQ
ncbi:hypothetical protein C2845_PM04G20890 [Panicum miliaceum]|uniref:Mitochondrial import inner membrane translocase subunit n=1 Tax=Panicum miliaceum TaxID=4540 RepID=A0A3L6QXJ5_PANMI|nr:hypothetical protein C2845_PM04G20890 [Panicum miliaceum]